MEKDSEKTIIQDEAGLGDFVGKVIEKTLPKKIFDKVKDCEACAKRKERLNRMGRNINAKFSN